MFLALIYATFISLGLPDSLLGASWPIMQPELGVPYSLAGVISMVVAGGTIVSSFSSGYLIRQFGAGAVTRVSVALTAVALFGFSQAPSLGWLLVMAIPLGLGAGAVDAALNHFVATHYQAHHMNWLHCFWGVGVMTGPLILSRFLPSGNWRGGYLVISLIQAALAAVLFASTPLWRRMERRAPEAHSGQAGLEQAGEETGAPAGSGDATSASTGVRAILQLPGVTPILLAFLLYCGLESSMGLWGSSFLVKARGFDVMAGAFGASLFFGSLTLGRFISGFISMKMSNSWLIRAGILTILAGTVVTLVPVGGVVPFIGFGLMGLGCAPIYPAMIHETPRRFGEEVASGLIGIQMGVAYIGSTFLPPAFGLISAGQHMGLLPLVALLYAVVMLFATERASKEAGLAWSRPV